MDTEVVISMSVYLKKLGKRGLLRAFRSLRFRNKYFRFYALRKDFESTSSDEFTLDDLLAGITDENKHEQIDYGPPVGRELL